MTDTNLDWKNLSFGYIRTDFNIRSYFRDGAWTKPELTSDETVTMHMAATALHYGQEAFEGHVLAVLLICSVSVHVLAAKEV